jgi:hypothetical protein
LKILHIIHSIDPLGGGPIEGIKQIANKLESFDCKVEILSLNSMADDCVQKSSLKIYAMGPGIGRYGFSKKFDTWLSLHYKEYDAIFINGIWQYHSFAAHRILKKNKFPYYVFTHGMLDPWFKHNYPFKHLKKCLYWIWGEYPVLHDAQKVIFTCEDEKNLARQSFWPNEWNEIVISYGTSGHSGNVEFQRQLFLKHFPLLKDKRCILFFKSNSS